MANRARQRVDQALCAFVVCSAALLLACAQDVRDDQAANVKPQPALVAEVPQATSPTQEQQPQPTQDASDTSLTIVWTEPSDSGGATITAYDLRCIRSDATDKSDSVWTENEDIWSSGDLTYAQTGLSRETSYDVQLRAVNNAGLVIAVEDVWEDGEQGDGINIAVVDDGMHWAHADLSAHVSSSSNHNYEHSSTDIFHRLETHGAAVAGLIAAEFLKHAVRARFSLGAPEGEFLTVKRAAIRSGNPTSADPN